MKVTKEQLAVLREAIEPVDKEEYRDAYRARRIPRADTVKNIDERYRWDLFWHAGGYRLLSQEGLNGAHIDTALRAIVPPL